MTYAFVLLGWLALYCATSERPVVADPFVKRIDAQFCVKNPVMAKAQHLECVREVRFQ